jgi:hypothetical protein
LEPGAGSSPLRPDRSTLKKLEKEAGAAGEGEAAQAAPPEDKGGFSIPRPGDLVGGLFRLSGAVTSGVISPEQFRLSLEDSSRLLGEAFQEIVSGLKSIPDGDEEYSGMIFAIIKSIEFMLDVSLEEMSLFADDGDAAHIFNGQRLAQKAEADYIDLAKMIQADAARNPLAASTDTLGDLASRVMGGRMSLDTYRNSVLQLKTYQEEKLDEGRALLEESFSQALLFDGAGIDLVLQAVEGLKKAGEAFSQVVLSIYGAEEIREAVKDFVEDTLDGME